MAKKPKAKAPAKSAPPKKAVDLAALLSVKELSALLEITPRWIQKLASEGFIAKAGRNEFPLGAAIKGYIRFLKDEQKRASRGASENRVREARAIGIEMRNAREQGELVSFEEAKAYVTEVIGAFVAKLAGLPAQLTRDVSERRRIETAIDRLREEVADDVAKYGEAYEGLADTHSANGKGTAGRVGTEEPALS